MAGSISGVTGDGHEIAGGEEFIAVDSGIEFVAEHDFGLELIGEKNLEIGIGGLNEVCGDDATVVGHEFGEGGVGLEHADACGGDAAYGSNVDITKTSGHSAGNAMMLVGEGFEGDLWTLLQ